MLHTVLTVIRETNDATTRTRVRVVLYSERTGTSRYISSELLAILTLGIPVDDDTYIIPPFSRSDVRMCRHLLLGFNSCLFTAGSFSAKP